MCCCSVGKVGAGRRRKFSFSKSNLRRCVSPGFVGDYPYPHAHTLFFQEADSGHKLRPQQFRAKMLMFTFGNALARAHRLYGVRRHRVCIKTKAESQFRVGISSVFLGYFNRSCFHISWLFHCRFPDITAIPLDNSLNLNICNIYNWRVI